MKAIPLERIAPAGAGARRLTAIALVAAVFGCARADGREATDWGEQRRAMVATVRAHAAHGPTPISDRVLATLERVPRHEFVPESMRAASYQDRPLPIGQSQTISQPYIVALMTELADVAAGEKVLEVGTGSGYQAAVLADLGARVYTIEIVEPLGRAAARLFEKHGYDTIEARIGDGYAGWPEHAPFDAILVTAAPTEIPAPLIEQLAPGGRLVVPVGGRYLPQRLTVVEKDGEGATSKREVLAVQFVPLTRDP